MRVQYSAVTEFYFSHLEMKIPENLLKHKDLSEMYETAFSGIEVAEVVDIRRRGSRICRGRDW